LDIAGMAYGDEGALYAKAPRVRASGLCEWLETKFKTKGRNNFMVLPDHLIRQLAKETYD